MNRAQRDGLLYLVGFGFFAVLGVLLLREVPPGNKELLQMLLMPLSGAFGYLVGFKPPAKDEAKP